MTSILNVMHNEILSPDQNKLLRFISGFSKEYYLVGGTAIALHIGHRQSIDFDLFTNSKVKRKSIKYILAENDIQYTVLHEAYDQIHILISDVKITFFNYPYKIEHKKKFEEIINIPDLIDLAAMKAYALGGRAKWKDYVDLYFILKDYHSINEIATRARGIYKETFNSKLFKQQLAYFKDIDYSEEVVYLPGQDVSKEEIKRFLIDVATEEF